MFFMTEFQFYNLYHPSPRIFPATNVPRFPSPFPLHASGEVILHPHPISFNLDTMVYTIVNEGGTTHITLFSF